MRPAFPFETLKPVSQILHKTEEQLSSVCNSVELFSRELEKFAASKGDTKGIIH